MEGLLFWGGVLGTFYLLWSKTLPKGPPLKGLEEEGELEEPQERRKPVKVDANGKPQEPQEEEAQEPAPAYNPAKNPFRDRVEPENAPDRKFRGSFDDLDSQPEIEDIQGEEEGVEGDPEELEGELEGEEDQVEGETEPEED